MQMAENQLGTLEISHLLTALEVLRQTDYFMPAPAYLLQQEDATAGITGLSPPREGDLSINYALVAHRRTSNSAAAQLVVGPDHVYHPRVAHIPLQRKMRQRITAGSRRPTAIGRHEQKTAA